jgi:hypothetical protein
MSLGSYLRTIQPHLGAALVPPEAWSRLQALGDFLPPFSKTILECRLDARNAQVDLSVNLPRFMPPFDDRLTAEPLWQHVEALGRTWAEAATTVCAFVREMWLEFDVDLGSSVLPPPNVFFALERLPGVRERLEGLVGALTGREVCAATSRTLARVLQTCPTSARVAHVGAMLARGSSLVRLVVADVPADQFSPWLERAGWRDTAGGLSAMMGALSPLGDEFYLDIDVGETVCPRVAVECFIKEQPPRGRRWQALVDDLTSRGLCSSSKGNALLAWPGWIRESQCPGLWPENLQRADRVVGHTAASVFRREISHVKIVYEPGRVVEAKAYLRFRHDWIPYRALAAAQEKKNV